MQDRELLEAAARAAGYADAQFRTIEGWGDVRYGRKETIWSKTLFEEDGSGYWNPLVDDGEALRLAVKLNFVIDVGGKYVMVRGHDDFSEAVGDNPLSATRRAIVRAAAAMVG